MKSDPTPAFVLARVCAPVAQAWLPVSESGSVDVVDHTAQGFRNFVNAEAGRVDCGRFGSVESITPIGLGKRALAPRGSGPFRGLSSSGHNPSVTVSNLVTPKTTRKAGTCPSLEYSIRS
jgi:hypothetical protein